MSDQKPECRFMEEDKVKPAINQLEHFISKVRMEVTKGDICRSVVIKFKSHPINAK